VLTLSRKRTCISILLVLPAIAVGLWAGAVHAHTFVVSTEPKAGSTVDHAPTKVLITFAGPVEIAFGGIEVLDPDRNRVEIGETEYASEDRTAVRIRLAPELANGPYAVEWRVVAADGHPREGRFRFRLDQPAPPSPTPTGTPEATHVSPGAEMAGAPPDQKGQESEGAGALPSVLLGMTRWILFASLLLLVGLGAFALVVWAPTASSIRPTEVDDRFQRRWWPILAWAWGGAVVASVASLAFEGAVAADVPLGDALSGEILGAVLRTRFGLVTVARLALLLVVGAVLLRARAGRGRRVLVLAEARRSVGAAAAPVSWGSLSAWAVLGLWLLVTIGLTGHAGTTSPVALGMTADLAHLAGAALWLSGLIGLVLMALPSTRGLADGERVSVLAPVVARFSSLAVWCVALIVASGVVRAWMEIRTLAGLTGYAYGITLLIKLGVVVPLLVLGAINNRWTKPRIRRAAADASLTGSGASALRTLNRLVAIEVLLAVVVLTITAVLVSLPPPVDAMEGGH
jgi:copper transport protein